MNYFGTYLTPYAIEFIFLETKDIVTEAKSIWIKNLYIPLIVGIPYFFICYLIYKFFPHRTKIKLSYLFLILFFGYFVYNANKPNKLFQMMFKNTCYTSFNTINSFSVFFGKILPDNIRGDNNKVEFEKYIVTKIDNDNSKPMNIIFVIGESINVDHMSLFGYERDTTPKLKEYADKDANFIYKRAWGAAVNTLIALPMIYNIQVNPKNYKKLVQYDTNLFNMAKENGFKITYVELQSRSVFLKTGIPVYDNLFIYDEDKDSGEKEYLIETLKKIDTSGRNFIVIHKRNVHSPYESNYKNEKDKYDRFDGGKSSRINPYDNAILYEDDLLDELIRFAEETNQETYFYYTSDHGEALGAKGMWGHGHLDEVALEVPFIFTMFNASDKEYSDKVKNIYNPCAHDIGLLIAEKIGYKIEVPNEELNICQINGRNSMGKAGILKVIKAPGETVRFERIM